MYRFVGGVAVLLTLLNAAKPLTIDDTAYHAMAGQIARHPLDPYGFMLYWYDAPQPAFDILMPPLLPYWLAVPVRVFGGDPVACKLWLFPFALLLVAALYHLFRRWARGIERPLVLLTVVSAAVLPSFNLMLDVPVLALHLGALAVFTRAVDRDRPALAIAAGILAGLGAETKFTGLLTPVLLLLYAIVWRRWRLGALAAAVALALFAAWEAAMWWRYGHSTFLYHTRAAAKHGRNRLHLTQPLVSNLGGVAAPVALLGLAALRLSRRWLALAATLIVAGYALIAVGPPTYHVLEPIGVLRKPVTVSMLVSGIYGVGLLGVVGVAAARLVRRGRWRWERDDLFLILWLALELAGYYLFTPFPAVRRVLGVFVAAIAMTGRFAARTCRSAQRRRIVGAVAAYGIALSLAVFVVDFRDAAAPVLALQRAMQRIGTPAPDATLWYTGHWGLQFYAERAGMRAVVARHSLLRRGDWLVVPDGHINQPSLTLPYEKLEEIEPPIEISDSIPFATVSAYYAGAVPILPQHGPRLRLSLFRVRDDFVAEP